MKRNLKKVMTAALVLVMALAMAACGAPEEVELITVENGAVIGDGAAEFTLEIVDADAEPVVVTVKTDEETRVPFMFLENCCFGRRELMVLNMVELGVFGKIVHCAGGYHHDLREEIAYGRENRHYRLRNYLTRNCS